MNIAASLPKVAGVSVTLFALAVVVIAGWCVPIIIAALYDLPRKGAIAVLSLLLGWTGAAWLAALVIAVVGAIRAPAPADRRPQYPEYPQAATQAYRPQSHGGHRADHGYPESPAPRAARRP
ncbi:MAG TPA: superinfection immunity protein [Streptosporangiaceae bacterium]